MVSPIPARYTIPESIPHELFRENISLLLSRDVKVTVLVAPSGYGKSVVTAQWARQQTNVIWIRLTQEDRDAQYLVHALAESIRTFGITLNNWNDHILREVSVSKVVIDLLNDVNLWPDDLTFILDGGEYLSADSAGVLANFADGLIGHRIVLLQHNASPFELAPYVVRGIGQEINAQHLAFTAVESAALSRTFRPQNADIQALHENLDGWPAGVMLSLYAHVQRLTLTPDDLIRTLIQQLDPRIQAQLPALSVIELWTAATPAALHLNLPSNWLADLQRVGLPLTAHGRTYAPHDVLRAYLQQELTNSPEQERQMHRYAGAWAERQGEPYTAVKHFLAANDEKSALKVAEDLLPGWYRTANWRVARDVLSQFPDDVLSDELRSILALAYGETNDASKAEQLALLQLSKQETATAYFTLALKGYRTNDYEKALSFTDRGLEVSESQRDLIQLLRTKAILLLKIGKADNAIDAAREAVRRATAYGDNSLKMSAQNVYAHVLGWVSMSKADNLSASENLYLTARETENPHRLMPIIQQYAIDLGRVNRESEGIYLINNFIELYKEQYPLCQQLLLSVLAALYRKSGNIDKLLETAQIGVVENRKAGFHEYSDNCSSFIVWHYFGNTNTEMARATAVEAERYIEDNNFESPPELGRRALYRYAMNDFPTVEQLLIDAEKAQIEHNTKPEPLVYALKAIFEAEHGQSNLDTIVTLCKSIEFFTEDIGLLRDGWQRLKPIFSRYAKENPDISLIRNTIKSVENSKEKSVFVASIRTLGFNAISIQNSEMRLGYTTALEALVYHVLHPQEPQDDLARAIWNNTDLYKARGSAQKARGTLNKLLRDAVGSTTVEMIHTSGPGRRNLEWHINPDLVVNLDALQVLNSQSADEIHSLYHGEFLPGNSHEWVIEERQHLKQHISEIYQRKAVTEGHTREGLKWLMRAAIIDQEVNTFEKALHLSIILGDNNVRQSAEEALVVLAQGNEVQLSGWLN